MRLRAKVPRDSEEYIRDCEPANGIYNPSWLEIVPFEDSKEGAFYLLFLDENLKPLTEHFYESIEHAKQVANKDYLVPISDWIEIGDEDSSID